MLAQIIQIIGSLLILAAFAAAQFGWLHSKSRSYLLLNVVGAGVLAVCAAITGQWGFLLLEGVWAVVSIVSLIAVLFNGPSGARREDVRTVNNA